MAIRSHIMVIDPATRRPELDCLNHIAGFSLLPVSYHLPALFGMQSISLIAEADIKGIVVLGSSCSVNDNLEWHPPLNQWLKKMMLAGVPTLGCCYGHQLIAHLFGGKVKFVTEDKFKFVGTRTVQLSTEKRLGLPQMENRFVISHNEHVYQLPENFKIWGSSELLHIDAMYHQTLPIWSMQPHPEATAGFAQNIDNFGEFNDDTFKPGHKVVKAFLDFCVR